MMSVGGNEKLKMFFAEFDLLDETPQNRYKTHAAEYYRAKLRAEVNGEELLDEKPEYLHGKTIIVEQMRSAEEIMTNNPPY